MSLLLKTLLAIFLACVGIASVGMDSISHLPDMPLAFTQNQGQWPDSILFRAEAGGAVMWFARDGIYYQFTRSIPPGGQQTSASAFSDRFARQPDSCETMIIKAVFAGSNPTVAVVGEGLLDCESNYFLGRDQSKWRTNVPSYGGIVYKNIYAGIDLRFYGDGNGRAVYEFAADHDVDMSRIEVIYEGNVETSVDAEGRPLATTAWGEVIEAMGSPHARSGTASPMLSEVPKGSQGLDRPPSKGVALGYSTFLGGSGYDAGYGIAVDGSGCAYVTGGTESADFPTQNAYDASYVGYDLFVTKFSAAGNSLVYSTFLGGSDTEEGFGIAVDGSGCAYVTGSTSSSDFPTQNAYDASYDGGYDVFMTKFSAAGNSLVYSTFLGGSSDDEEGGDVAVDGSGCAYVTGYTASSDFPTQSAYDASYNGGYDVFVTKFSGAGNSLVYSTFLGGSGNEEGYSIAVDGSDCVYVAVTTSSSNFPTRNAYDATYNGGNCDVLVTKLAATGNTLDYSTFLGGTSDDYGFGIAVDGSGCAYVAGETKSSNFPVQSAFDASYNGGEYDVFLAKFSLAGSSVIFSTFFGGSNEDNGFGVAVDSSGCAYLTGVTYSSDFPTENAYDATLDFGDVFVTEFSAEGNTLVYSTFLGGGDDDEGFRIAVDGSGCAYITGGTPSSDFPTQNAFDASYNGYIDAFVTKLSGSWGCCMIRGDINHSGADPDISDLVALVAFMFGGQPYSGCEDGSYKAEADINGNGGNNPDISDLTALVTYMFGGGPAPVPCP